MESDFKEICSVTKMIAMLGISKARFYQLIQNDIFPPPVYCIRTKKPFYTDNLQQHCLNIRKTGIGYNGKPVIFYAARKANNNLSKEKSNDYVEIIEALKNNEH